MSVVAGRRRGVSRGGRTVTREQGGLLGGSWSWGRRWLAAGSEERHGFVIGGCLPL